MSRHRIGTRIVIMGAVLALLVAACSSDTSTTTATSVVSDAEGDFDPAGEMRIAFDLALAASGGLHLDPTLSGAGGADLPLQHLIYDALLRPRPDGSLEPALASEAVVVDDHTIEIKVRDGVSFSDGTPFDGSAVKAGIERNLAVAASPAFAPEFYALSELEVTAELDVTLRFDDPVAPGWYRFLGGIETVIVAPSAVAEEVDLDTDPIGAGPYALAEYTPESTMVLERREEYWDVDSIRIARVVLAQSNIASGTNALLSGEVDYSFLTPDQVEEVEREGLVVGVKSDPNRLVTLPLCKSEPPFDDERVRQALSFGIDRDQISDLVFGGAAEPAWDLWPGEHRFHDPAYDGVYAHDPERARELLDEAGYGDGLEFDVMPIQALDMPIVAQVIQQQWEEIGVTTTIVPSTSFVSELYFENKAPVGVIPLEPADLGKLSFYIPGNTGNLCSYDSTEIARISTALEGVAAESPEAVELWHEAQDIVVPDALSIFVVFQPNAFGYVPTLGAVSLMPYIQPFPDLWTAFVRA
jgi:ABC-type transport system substrate-binding protein